MPSPQSPSLINEYSNIFTSLQTGKRQLIQWGADAVVLNRYIVDAAGSTGVCDPQPVLQTIDLGKVDEGGTEQQRLTYCENALAQLVALQEQSAVLQKSARESGISAGLLTIVGQAASQSPDDNGASVLRQLGELVGDDQKQDTDDRDPLTEPDVQSVSPVDTSMVEQSAIEIELHEAAANDIDRLDYERSTALSQLGGVMREHWRPLLLDAGVCVIATGIAISLIN